MRLRILSIIAIGLLCCQWVGFAEPAAAQAAGPSSQSVSAQMWNLKDADIRAVIDTVSLMTGKTFIVDPRVSGKISIVSQHPMTPDEMYQTFLSMLEALNYVAIPAGVGVKITPALDAKNYPVSSEGDVDLRGATPVVRVIPLHHMSATQLVPILRSMLPKWGSINAYSPTNSIIVAGSASSIKHIMTLVADMERNSAKQVAVVKLQYASAKNTGDVLHSLLQSSQSKGQAPTIALAADPQSNTILLSGNVAEVYQAKQLLTQLDQPDNSMASTAVIPLNYLDAQEIQPILANIASGSSDLVAGSTPTAADFASNPGSSSSSTTSNYGSSSLGHAAAIAGPISSGAMTAASDQDFSSSISIQAMEATNSIIIHAPKDILHTLKSIVTQMDKRPHQVLVQAVIAKVDQKLLNQLGIQWSTVDSSGNSVNGQDGQFNVITTSGVGMLSGTNIQALVSALTSNTSTDLLATPSVMVLDNQLASISDGTNIGVVNRSYDSDDSSSDTSTYNDAYNTIERMDVDLSLQVIPHVIASNNMIKMEIKQIDDSINQDTAEYTSSDTNPELDTSEIDTTVMVRSGDILVLGGLINNDNEYKTERVPVIGNIPLIGQFFTYKYKKHDKKDLVVFIRPINMSTDQLASATSANHLKYLSDLQGQLGSNNEELLHQSLMMPAGQKPIVLPAPRATVAPSEAQPTAASDR